MCVHRNIFLNSLNINQILHGYLFLNSELGNSRNFLFCSLIFVLWPFDFQKHYCAMFYDNDFTLNLNQLYLKKHESTYLFIFAAWYRLHRLAAKM